MLHLIQSGHEFVFGNGEGLAIAQINRVCYSANTVTKVRFANPRKLTFDTIDAGFS